jgi:hypothetical protein
MTFAEFLVHPDLFDEIIKDLLLIPVDPAGYIPWIPAFS